MSYVGDHQAEKIKQEFEVGFGRLTTKQLWILVKLAKYVRLRCRNNVAFNNFFSRLFPYASFNQVKKVNPDLSEYFGLRIQVEGENEDEPFLTPEDEGENS